MHRTRPDEKLDDLHVVGDLMGRYSSSPRSAVARVMAAALLSALLLAGLSTQAAAQTVPAITIHGGAAVTEGGYAIFTVTASTAPTSDLMVHVNVADAGGSSDFLSASSEGAQTVTISADQTTGHLYVLSEDDAIDEPSGSVTATLQARSGYTLGASVSASVQVKDNDPPPTITIAAVTTAVTEGQPAVFTVTANPAPADDLTVNLRARDAGAWFYWPEKAGVGTFLHSYYVNATVTIPGGTSSVNYELPTRDDNFHENGASVSVSLKPRGGYSLGNPKEAWVRVNDNDPDLPIITIAAGPLVTEGTPSAFTITANRAPVSNLTVNLHVAEYGFGDHVAPGETGIKQVTIPAGDRSARYSVATVDDTTHEGQGHVTVNLRSGDGYVVGAGDFWAVNRVNNNDPRPGISVITITGGAEVTEGSPATFTFEASPAPASNLAVKFSVADVDGAGDFVASTEEGSKEVTILAGASSASYSVPTVDDATGDADGEVTVTGASGSSYEFRRGTAKVWVRDNDNPVIVSLRRVDSGKIYESGSDDRAELTVSLNRALAAGEYLEVPLDIHTLRSSGHSRYGLRPSDFALSLKSGAGVTLNRATFMTRTATSDRYPVLLFEGAGAQTATLEVVAQHDGVAESHQDEEFAVIILPSKETVSGFRWLTNVADGTRRASSNYSVKIAISDSDTVSILRFIQPTGACCVEYRAREGEPIQIRLRLSAPLAKNATFTLMDKGYTLPAPSWQTRNAPQAATAGADYARGPWTVTIPAGQRQAWVRIGTFKDGDANEGGVNGAANLGFGLGSFREDDMYEVFHVWVDESKLPPGVFVPSNWPVPVYGSSRAIRAAILDEEKPALSFESRSMVVQEDAGTVTLKVKVDPPSKSPINVEYRLLGTATPRVDYRIANAHDRNGNSGLLRIPANQGTVDMQVEIIDDALEDTNETIRIELTARSDATGQQYRGYQVFSNTVADPSSISLVIRNDDGLPMVNIAPKAGSPSSVPEGSATAFTVTRSAAAATPLTVSVDVLESAGSDFVASGDEGRRSVTIAANEATADFTVGTVNDSTDEPDGTVTAKLAAGTGYALWPAPDDEASVAVTDDDVPPPPTTCPATSADLVEKVRGYYELNRDRADRNHGENWLRVLIAFGAETHATLQPYTSAEARARESAWDGWVEVREELERLEACGNTQQPLVPPPTPEITLAGGAGVTEGGDAEFTLTATPAPASDIQVSVTVAEVGSFAASGATGARTVTVGTGGTATFTVATENDTADEPDGMINAGVAAGSGYTLGSSTVASVAVTDDDDPPLDTCAATSADLVEKVRGYYELNRSRADRSHGENWLRVLIAFGAETHATLQPYTSAEARAGELAWDGWVEVREELERLEGCGGSQQKLAPPPTPVITISGGAGVTEGGDAVFTLTAAPAPASDIDVSVTVAETGSFAASGATGARTVTVGAGGTAAFTVATENDTTDEPNGSIEAAVGSGSGYTLGSSATASVAVSDNDDPPEVNITASAGGTEGGSATFTLTATPPPASDLIVGVTVASTGDYGVVTGDRNVTIPTGGSASLAVATTDDTADEPNGTVTVTLNAGSGYTVGALSTGTADILDDDAPVQPQTCAATSADLVEKVRGYYELNRGRADRSHGENWLRVLIAFGAETHATLQPYTSAEARAGESAWDGWVKVREELERLEGCGGSQQKLAPPPTPVITISAGAGITEGGGAEFTLTAAPAPASDIQVSVTVTETGSFAASGATGTRTVTVGTGGTATFTVATENDTTDEADGSIAAEVAAGTGYTVGSSATASVAVSDNDDPPVPEITISGGAGVTEGGDAEFTLTAAPAPASAIQVSVTVTETGSFAASGATGTRTVTVGTGGTAAFAVATENDTSDEPEGSITAAVAAGSGYTVGSSATASVSVTDDDIPPLDACAATSADLVEKIRGYYELNRSRADRNHGENWLRVLIAFGAETHATLQPYTSAEARAREPAWDGWVDIREELERLEGCGGSQQKLAPPPTPVITISAGAGITEGVGAVFTLTAVPAPASDIEVSVTVTETGDFAASGATGARTVTVGTGGTAAFTVATEDDAADEADGSVAAEVAAGAGYAVGSPSSAEVAVSDDDAPASAPSLSVSDASGPEGRPMKFTVRLSPPSDRRVSARVETRESSPGSAREGVDYGRNGWSLTFGPGETEKHRWVYVFDDAHDDGGETFEFVVTRARGAEVADAVGVGTIENADPLPGAWLARLGRTVAEQAIEGVAGRVSALRGAGFDSSFRAARAPFPDAAAAASPALSRTVPGMAPRAAEFPGRGRPDRADQGCLSAPIAGGRGDAADRLRSLAVRSHFTATGGRDALGGAWSLWGRASENRFGGAARGEGTDVSLDGRVATGLLGADYGRDGWLLGVALARSSADGGYAALGEGVRHEAGSEAAGQEDGGEGRVASSLTAVVPYASMKATESLRVWGAAGLGAGEVALRTRGGRLGADTEWTMAAAGLRSERLSPAGGGGLSLAVVSDALWTRLSSDGADGLRGTESDTTRLRLGLEGAWRIGLAGGGHVTPRLELGARRDGGDAERGFGVEAGGGVAWQAPALGLAVEVSARALVSHEDSDLDDRGFSVSLAYDPDAATGRGLSLRLTQEAGGRARGGLDALFAPAPLAARGSGYGAPAAGRDWRMEAAYGFALLGGRYTGSPHAGFGRSRHSRDWTVGWRLAPEGAAAADMAVGISAFRRAYTGAPPEHGLGLEFTGRW